MKPPPATPRAEAAEAVPTIPTLIGHMLGNDVLAAICRDNCERGCAPDERCLAQWNHWTGRMDPVL